VRIEVLVLGAALALAACRHRPGGSRAPDASTAEEGGATDGSAADGDAASAADVVVEAQVSRRELPAEQIAAWCREATRHKARGPEGSIAAAFGRTAAKACREHFAYRAERFIRNKPDDYEVGQYVTTIVHLADSGQTEVVYEFHVSVTMEWGNQSLDEFEVGDIDGDGTAEVYYGVFTHGEGTFEWERRLLTMRDGKLEPVPLPHDYRANGLIDADGDGLWDVRTAGPYAGIVHGTAIGGDVPFFHEPGPFLLHSLGGFRFAIDDAVSRTNLRWECRLGTASNTAPPLDWGPEPNEGAPDWRMPLRLLCARVEGQDAAQVRAALRTQCKRFGPPGKGCLEELLRIADTEPPVRFNARSR
jgi:hypothetical protein